MWCAITGHVRRRVTSLGGPVGAEAISNHAPDTKTSALNNVKHGLQHIWYNILGVRKEMLHVRGSRGLNARGKG